MTALAALNQPNAGDNAGRGWVVIHAVSGEWRELKKRRIRVKQRLNPFAGKKFPSGFMPLARRLRPTQLCGRHLFFEGFHQRGHMGGVVLECR